MPDPARPVLLFYCQHAFGIGHLTRSFALARALSRAFRVVFLNGGELPAGVPVPEAVEIVDLPPLSVDAQQHRGSGPAAAPTIGELRRRRRDLLVEAVRAWRPACVLVELFPFGRKKFAGEILPLIRAARRQPDGAARIVCSLRDILVDERDDQQHFDDRARWLADRYFDAVLVHSDPGFARIDESFRPRRPLSVPVHYTGYVVPQRSDSERIARGAHILVSAGGGVVGFPLFAAALEAHALLWPLFGLSLRLIAGPFLPEVQWSRLVEAVRDRPGVELVRHVPDMVVEMRRAGLSVSQCGYNTALDLVVSGVPALIVPYAAQGENEQSRRAEALARLEAVRVLAAARLDGPQLAAAIAETLEFRPRPAALALDGAPRTAELLAALCRPPATAPRGQSPC